MDMLSESFIDQVVSEALNFLGKNCHGLCPEEPSSDLLLRKYLAMIQPRKVQLNLC